MATFLHRLCLFGLLATTGFALSNCQRQGEEAQQETQTQAPSGPTMSAADSQMPAQPDGGMRVGEVGGVDAGEVDGGMR